MIVPAFSSTIFSSSFEEPSSLRNPTLRASAEPRTAR
nr:MAG TPA: hypothetical protein [Caudoviricetes sp.]